MVGAIHCKTVDNLQNTPYWDKIITVLYYVLDKGSTPRSSHLVTRLQVLIEQQFKPITVLIR